MVKYNRRLDKIVLIITGVLVFIVIALGLMYFNQQRSRKDLLVQLDTIEDQIVDKSNIARVEVVKRKEKEKEVIIEYTGFNPDIIDGDTALARSFFRPAFEWQNGESYDDARFMYIDQLGEDNAFTKTYLPENVTIETNDGVLSYIDNIGLKVSFDSMTIVPLTVVGETVRYAGFVKYYPIRDTKDLAAGDKLTSSEAIIEFTVSDVNGERVLSEVDAWPGYQSGVNLQ